MIGRDFIDSAELLASEDTEANQRSAIGRYYYAAYIEARTWCETHLGYERTRSSREHVEIPRLLQGLDAEVVANLSFLRLLRNGADYDMGIAAQTIAIQLVTARTRALAILERLDALPIPPQPVDDPANPESD